MAPSTLHLPNGQTVAVTAVYGGYFFKPNDLNTHHAVLPPGWTIQIHSDDDESDHDLPWRGHSAQTSSSSCAAGDVPDAPSRRHEHRFKTATLQGDSVFISSISNPSNTDFKPASSPTRQIAMMLWVTLYWYFHQPEPDARLTTTESAKTAEPGRPRGDWRLGVKREGVLRGRNLLQKLERMGLIASEESCVGTETDERTGEGWQDMFISRRSFWQLDARIFLFTLTPAMHSPGAAGSPYTSRPGSPSGGGPPTPQPENQAEAMVLANAQGLWAPSMLGPFASASHLPTFFPPPPPHYTFTGQVRHPMRPKPPRQGETFYTRYIPSVGQYLSFRVASVSARPPAHLGPTSALASGRFSRPTSTFSDLGMTGQAGPQLAGPNDVELLHAWMNDPRVSRYWGEQGPQAHQEDFLLAKLRSRHSFPAIGCWDGKPFGYFEIEWVKEDRLGRHVDGDDYDRGIQGLVGEQEFRGAHRVRVWLSALVHYCFLADSRTQSVLLEPRVDNERFIEYLHDAGFHKEREVAFPHQQSALMRLRREAWEAPFL